MIKTKILGKGMSLEAIKNPCVSELRRKPFSKDEVILTIEIGHVWFYLELSGKDVKEFLRGGRMSLELNKVYCMDCLDKHRVREVIKQMKEFANMKYANGDYMVEHSVRGELLFQADKMLKELELEE